MKRNYGIWYVIAAIIVIGVATTNYTNKLVNSQQTQTTAMTASATEAVDLSGSKEEKEDIITTPEETAGARMAEAAPMPDAAMETIGETIISPAETRAEQRAEAGNGKAKEEIKPETRVYTLAENVEETGIVESSVSGTNAYENRLSELDAQIKRLREEETDSNTNSIKTTAETELKLWDGELNLIYGAIIGELDEKEKEELIMEEREWMKDRDALAVAAAKKSGGGTMEGLEYTASLADSTRKRVYELAATYKDVLDN
ncbi:DUF1311 domain-containing protein [Clostridium sp. MCC353]|uniref:lysozyme inhibitor LprI family protein n=1 Tax=Clostridium sp. MCC353 TaxID=2592646 RepID=UPI001C02F6A8|nr:lysozyme inhibitor LprI family protein [Clostridium sp. MCC353]MBT9779596.1 DUF1311 domain-containing protein [Clostridium sp. MCC353]